MPCTKSESDYTADLSQFEFSESDTDVLARFSKKLAAFSGDFLPSSIDAIMSDIVTETGLGKGKVFKPIRLGVSAEANGPHIGDLVTVLGKDRVIQRLTSFVK